MAYESHYGYGDRYQYDRQRRRRERNRYEEARINRDYYDGHHWPYWVGPTLPGDAEGYAEKMSLLERAFQQHAVIGRRHLVEAVPEQLLEYRGVSARLLGQGEHLTF